jgi:tetratricopeptide (TPR) repeat protein
MRDQLALAADCEKHQQYQEAADRYREALASWPDDPLAPKALVGYGRLHLQVFKQPREALELLEQARAHPHATAEFQQASAELIAAARRALGPRSVQPKGAPRVSPSASNSPVLSDLPPPEAAVQTDPATPAMPPPGRPLAPVPVRAVGIDARGLHLEDRRGRTGHLPWRQVTAISVARIGEPDATADLATRLILDLVLDRGSRPGGNGARCVRLSPGDLAIPQLEGEPSPVRAFQRFVATILKATGVAAHPSRDACLGVHGFPSFPDAATYEADLIARLDATGSLILFT